GSDFLQTRNLGIVPNPRITVRDAAAALDGGRFDEHRAGAALRELAEVDEMPVAHQAVRRGVLAHRRHHEPVPQGDAPELERIEQHQLCWIEVLRPADLRSVIAEDEPLPFQASGSMRSPRKLSSIVTSSGSLRKIWKSGGWASGKLRKCISTLLFWMRPRTASASC